MRHSCSWLERWPDAGNFVRFLVGVSELDEQAGVRHEFAGAV